VLFFVLNGVGLGIQLSCIAVSHYGFGFDSLFADNVAKVIGLLIGTVFRFLTTTRWVFVSPERAAGRSVGEGSVPEIDVDDRDDDAIGAQVSYADEHPGMPATDRR
jgi:hypothetical protein